MDTNGVKKLAALARLHVPEEEIASIAQDINNIIGFVDKVQARSTKDIDVILDVRDVYRDDIVAALVPEHDLVEAAPLHKDHFVQVPKVIE